MLRENLLFNQKLPPEMLLEVLLFLAGKENLSFLLKCALVSRGWREVVETNALWRFLTLARWGIAATNIDWKENGATKRTSRKNNAKRSIPDHKPSKDAPSRTPFASFLSVSVSLVLRTTLEKPKKETLWRWKRLLEGLKQALLSTKRAPMV